MNLQVTGAQRSPPAFRTVRTLQVPRARPAPTWQGAGGGSGKAHAVPLVSTEPLARRLVARPLGTSGRTEPGPGVRRHTCCGGLSQPVSPSGNAATFQT